MSDPGVSVIRFFGAILMAIGGLLAVLCGGCTTIFVGIALWEVFSGQTRGEDMQIILFSALFLGGIPIVVGAVLFFAGRAMRKAGP